MHVAQVDGVETVMSLEQAIQTQSFPTRGVPVLLGSNLDEGSTFMCVSDQTSIVALAMTHNACSHPKKKSCRHTDAHMIQ